MVCVVSALDTICELSLLVLYSALRGFLCVLRFFSLIKNQHFIRFDGFIYLNFVSPTSRAIQISRLRRLKYSEYSYYDYIFTIKFDICCKIHFTQRERLRRGLCCMLVTGETFKVNADMYHVLYIRE